LDFTHIVSINMVRSSEMSVISKQHTTCFKAPVVTGARNILIVGSWEPIIDLSHYEMRISNKYTGHVRLSTWRQQFEKGIVETCLDWVFLNTNDAYIVVRFLSMRPVTMCDVDQISEKIHTILEQHTYIHHIQLLFQQMHPGDNLDSGITGKDGKDGESQSD